MSATDIDLDALFGPPEPEPQQSGLREDSDEIPFSVEDLDRDPVTTTQSQEQHSDPNDKVAKLEADNARMQQEMHDLRAQVLNRNQPSANTQTPVQNQTQYAPPQPQPQVAQNSREAFNSRFFADPYGAMQEMLLPALQQTITPIQEANASQYVEHYIDRAQREDPNFQFAEEEFRKIVSEPSTARTLASLPHAGRVETLRMAKQLAVGRAYEAAAQRGVEAGTYKVNQLAPKYGAALTRATTTASQKSGWSKFAENEYRAMKRDNPSVDDATILAFFKENGIR